ncbi:MarR family winged helix-turn-helix transcriptional regulator [Rhizobium rosettiformans]|uniref:MarR family transcriptional regulator n=2 Tax=Rhizobium rosettiformans TaxID=1368430 RepID=A0A4S8Q2N4_9HYPH|nr:MarR family transcriptional regulator [Rhizobium rosettiformans]MBA4797314.1 MarR family transcriptional regulator [Hyphomicrobiales bacterium]MBB5274087.1 MarR family transcriptional regulator for hemolysin [Rhizobium rosettiformans]MDR7027001.1 MarR family transcriptional regulator for hemolysin [Rhizobium rosettiformans]MDR7065122.1 MarR family transcriptional regulator for hemolysin [Rhizobium rosettiformans]THV38250.1 MarR family transcriptional regulator [Rhizobium rosettiformans W3]
MSRQTQNEQLFDEMSAFNRKLRAFFDAAVREEGLTLARARALFAISRRGPLTQKELAEELEIETPTLVRVLDGMARQNLIVRTEDENDRRAKRIAMTEAGRAAYDRMHVLATDLRAQIAAEISSDDIEIALSVVRRLTRNLQSLDQPKVRS